MKKRYVSGNSLGNLQSNTGDTARVILAKRSSSYFPVNWFTRNYPIIYELVPVLPEQLKPKRRKAAQAKGGE